MKLKGAAVHGVSAEIVEGDAVPARARQQVAVWPPQRYGFRHPHTAPDHEAEVQQADFQLKDARRLSRAYSYRLTTGVIFCHPKSFAIAPRFVLLP